VRCSSQDAAELISERVPHHNGRTSVVERSYCDTDTAAAAAAVPMKAATTAAFCTTIVAEQARRRRHRQL